MAVTVLYRISSREVIKISSRGQTFLDRDSTMWGVLTDPSFPDGTDFNKELPDGTIDPNRQVGVTKIVVLPNTVRNATVGEIATFATAETNDNNILDSEQAKDLYREHPIFKKFATALLDTVLVKLNELSTAQGLPTQTLASFRNQVLNRISKDD